MSNDIIISNTYSYHLSNKIQFSGNSNVINIQNHKIVLNIKDGWIEGFQIKIDGLNQEGSRYESDRIANIFKNGIIAISSPPTFTQHDLSSIDHIYQSGKTTSSIYKSLVIKYDIEGNSTLDTNKLPSLVNDNSKLDLLEKINHTIKTYTKGDYFQAFRELYLLIENNDIIISTCEKKKFKVIRHLLSHIKINDPVALDMLDILIKNYPFEFNEYYYKPNNRKNTASFKFDSDKNNLLIKKLFNELLIEIKNAVNI